MSGLTACQSVPRGRHNLTQQRKLIVWDLDNTLWDGIALEEKVTVRPEVRQSIEELDRRGILHSIASRSDEETALKILREQALADFFLTPKINWLPKSNNIVAIAQEIGLLTDAIMFIDDDPFELEQVAFMLPEVMTIGADRAAELPALPEFILENVTQEARERRKFYQREQERRRAEGEYKTREEFLKSCMMKLNVREMSVEDIARIRELMTRSHQLNTTGKTYINDDINQIILDKSVKVAELTDRFGRYGIVGVAIANRSKSGWTLEYLAMSCRVLGRGIERAFLTSLLRDAQRLGFQRAEATFRDTGKNRMMRALYQMMDFTSGGAADESGTMIFCKDITATIWQPEWVELL